MIAQIAFLLEQWLPSLSILISVIGLGLSVYSAMKTRSRFYNDYLKRKRPND